MSRANSGVNLPALRSHNAALVLDLLRLAGRDGISRPELAERTGLTPQAVSKITARLREDGLVAEAGRLASTGGKPRTVLRLVRGARSAVGLHLDRDELTAVLTDLTGEQLAMRTVPFDFGASAGTVLDAAAGEVRNLLAEAGGDPVAGLSDAAPPQAEPTAVPETAPGPLLGVGIACPGPLDHRSGTLGRVTGLPRWDGYPLRDALAARLGLPAVLDKDTNAAALGLALRSAADGRAPDHRDSFAYLHLGTGLGAGLVLGGGLYRGSRTGAGEFGHQVIQLDGPLCECGDRGCVEALCLAAVARGDIPEAARVLGAAAANLVGLLDIDRVLLGGRTAVADGEAFVRGVGAVLAERAAREGLGPAPARTVPVGVAPDGERAVAYGAAQLVLAPMFGHGDQTDRGDQAGHGAQADRGDQTDRGDRTEDAPHPAAVVET
ncbi:ROK family protein [Streptomyces pathocidini]|uniref:ROK family protein n=2 Tax=Streptomyces pathocidini TaxID=1650571 RepID=A0ABW7UW63_9ACTN